MSGHTSGCRLSVGSSDSRDGWSGEHIKSTDSRNPRRSQECDEGVANTVEEDTFSFEASTLPHPLFFLLFIFLTYESVEPCNG